MMMIMNEDDAVRSFWDYALLLAKRMEHENKSSFTYFPQIRSGLKKNQWNSAIGIKSFTMLKNILRMNIPSSGELCPCVE